MSPGNRCGREVFLWWWWCLLPPLLALRWGRLARRFLWLVPVPLLLLLLRWWVGSCGLRLE